MKLNRPTPHHLKQGFTLIELMIALVLGVFLTEGALQVFISSKENFRVTTSNSELMQSGRMGLDFMTNSISLAGFHSNLEVTPYFTAAAPFPTDDQVITGTDSSITVRYFGYDDNLVTDCQGNPISTALVGNFAAPPTVMKFYLDTTDASNKKLMCNVSGKAPDVLLVENVDQLQIRYGISNGIDDNVSSYTTASNITGSNWVNVRAVRIGLLVKSSIRANSTVNKRSYTLFGTSYASNDNYLRESFVTTVGLWNKIQ